MKCTKRVASVFDSITSRTFSRIAQEANESLKAAFKKELKPYTRNHYLYEILIKLRNQPLIDAIKSFPASDKKIPVAAVLQILKNHGIGSESNEDREAKEIHMAVRAYLKVGKKRFIDTIPMSLELHFRKKIIKELKNELASISDEDLSRMLAESNSMIEKRRNINLAI